MGAGRMLSRRWRKKENVGGLGGLYSHFLWTYPYLPGGRKITTSKPSSTTELLGEGGTTPPTTNAMFAR